MKLGVRSVCVSRDFEGALRICGSVGLDGIQIAVPDSNAKCKTANMKREMGASELTRPSEAGLYRFAFLIEYFAFFIGGS